MVWALVHAASMLRLAYALSRGRAAFLDRPEFRRTQQNKKVADLKPASTFALLSAIR